MWCSCESPKCERHEYIPSCWISSIFTYSHNLKLLPASKYQGPAESNTHIQYQYCISNLKWMENYLIQQKGSELQKCEILYHFLKS